ncbi:hypothetical protein A7982_12219 [Minicystis rosea]|nr:hypothetical protein A7982_12219 [Minicystis rosea]
MLSLREALANDHRRLDQLFEELLNRVHVGDTALADATWTAFEQGLTRHMDAEEKDMISIFERMAPHEAGLLLAEHAKVRSLLAELGVMLEIHALREAKVEELVSFLRAHAAREDAALYQWADRELPEPPKQSVLERLRPET